MIKLPISYLWVFLLICFLIDISPGVGNGNPLQYSCLENPMDRAAWQAIVHGVKKSQSQLSTHVSKQASIIDLQHSVSSRCKT